MVNIGSGCLSPKINTLVFGLLESNSFAISTALVKLQFTPLMESTIEDPPRAACIVKDNNKEKYFIQVGKKFANPSFI
jgi:hypothetical protein